MGARAWSLAAVLDLAAGGMGVVDTGRRRGEGGRGEEEEGCQSG